MRTRNRWVIEVVDEHMSIPPVEIVETVRFMVGPVEGSSEADYRADELERVAEFNGRRTCIVHELYEEAD
jgi:hypothetical protein